MKWRGRRQSQNIEDRRGRSGRLRRPSLGKIRFPIGVPGRRGRLGRGRGRIGGLGLVVIVVIAVLLGFDPRQLLMGVDAPIESSPLPLPEAERSGADPLRDFVAVVLADTEDVWKSLLPSQLNEPYREPKLVLFTGGVRSACGYAGSAVGPFYCPGDQKVYLDLDFFRTLSGRLDAPGDFAQAYVIAHEVGHHVQTLLGISQQVHQARRSVSESDANALSVMLELQADCFAGAWAHHADRTKDILEAGDIDEALNAASAIGDDTLQKRSQGYVVPDSFTHGTSAQRQNWYRRGFETGQLQACDTFSADNL
ncbi:MAG: neutral zinc metallopeptidase [Kiloniellales bacterium]|nr:neutral zinc metallopeptidase [Kiloniellales bacterium]